MSRRIAVWLFAPLVVLPLVFIPLRAQTPVDSAHADSVRADSVERERQRVLRAALEHEDSVRTDSLRHYLLERVVVKATRLSGVDERASVEVEQVNLEQAVPIPIPTAAPTALEQLPGISTFNDQGSPLQPEIEVRGFTLSPVVGSPQGVGVFLNGVRVNEPDAQEVNFDLLPMAAVDGTSLVRGSNVLFGRNSLGGTLLLSTRRGGDKPEAEVELGGGSFGQQTYSFTGGGKADGFDGFVAGAYSDEVGWRDATAARTRNVFATIGRQFGASHDSGDIALDLLYGNDKILQAGSLPESYLADFPQLNYTPGDFFAPEAYAVILRGNDLVAGGVLRGTAFYRRNNSEQYNNNVPPVNPTTDGFVDNRSGGATLEWTRALVIGLPVGFTIGTEFEQDGVTYHLYEIDADSGDSLTTLAEVSPQLNLGAYAQAIVSVNRRLDVTLGVRGDYVRIPYVDQLVDSNSATSTYSRLSPELGASYRVSEGFKVYVAYRGGFRAPAALELACASPAAPCSLPSALGADPALLPVTTQDHEAGIDARLSRLTIDADAFWTDVTNDIEFASPTLTQVYYINMPKTRRAGFEVSTELALAKGLRLMASYSYVAATYQSSVQIATADTAPKPTQPGDIFPNSPLHRGRLGLGLSRQLGRVLFNGELDARFYSGQYLQGDESNQRAQIPGYTETGLRGRLGLGKYGLEFEIDNLLNDHYSTYGILSQNLLVPPGAPASIESPDGEVVPFLTPAPPRRFTLTFSARL